MEILKSVFARGGKRARALALSLFIALVALLITGGALCGASNQFGLVEQNVPFGAKPFGESYTNNIVALADNSNIGGSGGAIEIADVTEGKVSNTFSNKDTGVKLKITLPLNATNIYFAYEVDSSEQVWAINGTANINEDIPYLKHEGGVEAFEVQSQTLMDKVISSWTDISVIYEKKVFFVEVHYNGTFYVECDMSGETERLSASSIIKDIDNLSPSISTDRVTHGALNSQGQYVFEVSVTFYDTQSSSVLSSARSGLKELLIIRTDAELNDLTPEQMEGDGVETIKAWEPLSPLQSTLSQQIKFNLDKDGYYYYFAVDRVGNLSIGTLFNGKFERENHADTDDRFMICMDITEWPGGGTFSIKNNMVVIGQELNDYKDQTNSTIYTNALEAYSELLLRFYTGDAKTDKVSVTKDWFSFFNNEYTAFKNAYSVGATYTTEVLNGDLLGGATLSSVNLNKNTMPSLGGDTIKANFIVAKYNLSDLSQDIISASGLDGKGYAYKLNYTLTVNGVQSAIPNTDLIYELIGLDSTLTDFEIVVKVGDTYQKLPTTKGTNWIRFATNLNSAEYYLIATTEKSRDLLWLWITLGVVGGVLVAGGIVVIVLWKKGKVIISKK